MMIQEKVSKNMTKFWEWHFKLLFWWKVPDRGMRLPIILLFVTFAVDSSPVTKYINKWMESEVDLQNEEIKKITLRFI